MVLDSNQLDKILSIVKRLKDIPEFKSFIFNLRGILEIDNAPAMSFSDKRIDHIYEYCIEDIISSQADKFYEKFSIPELKPRLKELFVGMEFARRNDDFDEFCAYMYRQLEGIFSVLANDTIVDDIAHKIYSLKAPQDGQTVANQLFYQIKDFNGQLKTARKLNELQAIDLAVVLIYIICLKVPKRFDYQFFNNLKQDIKDIYQYRNRHSHEGDIPTPNQQKIYDRIDPVYNYYYFKFYGTFALIIDCVNKNYPIKEEFQVYVENRIKIELGTDKQ